jgi:hypothetical protein
LNASEKLARALVADDRSVVVTVALAFDSVELTDEIENLLASDWCKLFRLYELTSNVRPAMREFELTAALLQRFVAGVAVAQDRAGVVA